MVRELSQKCLWLKHGQMVDYGPTAEIMDRYENITGPKIET